MRAPKPSTYLMVAFFWLYAREPIKLKTDLLNPHQPRLK